jgi:hypothetical protein
MKKMICRILPVLAIALVIATVSGVASAQNPITADAPFNINYYSNNTTAGAPAGTLRIGYDGANGAPAVTLCANIYVYAADQQLAECCSCPVSSNGLIEENIKTNLLGNSLTRVTPNQGLIKIIGSPDGGVCDADGVGTLAIGLTAWTTHIENKVGTAFPVSVTQNSPSTLSAGEFATLQSDCLFAERLGSGFGICTCNAEATK